MTSRLVTCWRTGKLLLNDLIDSFKDIKDEPLIESVASDGELYGHHHPHGDMTLAYCIYYIVANNSVKTHQLR